MDYDRYQRRPTKAEEEVREAMGASLDPVFMLSPFFLLMRLLKGFSPDGFAGHLMTTALVVLQVPAMFGSVFVRHITTTPLEMIGWVRLAKAVHFLLIPIDIAWHWLWALFVLSILAMIPGLVLALVAA